MNTLMQHDCGTNVHVGGVYDAKVIGAPFKILLKDGFSIKTDDASGKCIVSITDLVGLLSAAVCSRVIHPRKLSGADLKFIRATLGLKAKNVAGHLDISPEYYSRCETGGAALSAAAERQLRMRAFLRASSRDRSHGLSNEQITQMANELPMADVKRVMNAFRAIFDDIKISPVHSDNDELSFTFSRCRRDRLGPCAGEEGDWQDRDEDRQAA